MLQLLAADVTRCVAQLSALDEMSALIRPTHLHYNSYQQPAEQRFGMLRVPHASTSSAERKILNDIKTPPFVLSTVEGLRQRFSAAATV